MPKKVETYEDVEAALPQGETYQLPEDWRKELAEIPQRFESPTSIRTYLSCPLRWYLNRYSDLPDEPSGFAAVVGSFVHRVLEVFYSEPSHYRDNALLNRTFRNAWDAIKQGSNTGIIPPDLQAEFKMLEENTDNADGMRGGFYKRSKMCIEAIEDFDPDPSHIKVESNESWVRMEKNGVIIRGKIDREIKGKLGGTIVQDYKTGRVVPDDDEPVSVLSDSFVPMGLYALMRSRGNRKDGMDSKLISAVQLLYLHPKVKFNIKVREHTLDIVDRLVDRVTTQMNDVVDKGEIIISPAESPDEGQCGWCPASGLCPIWNETGTFKEMREELNI